MITNSEIRLIRSLKEKKYREEHGLFVVEGEKMVNEALESSFEVVKVFRRDDIGEQAMARISMLNTPSPVLALVRIPGECTEWPSESGLYLALDSVRDPGNLGTIIRLADWYGIDGIYASYDTVEAYNPKTIQSTMGAVFRKKVQYCDLNVLCRRFRDVHRPVFGTFMDGEDIYEADLPGDALVIMGNEANGICPAVASLVSSRIHIPSFAKGPTAESLNVAVATAVTISEFRRRNRV